MTRAGPVAAACLAALLASSLAAPSAAGEPEPPTARADPLARAFGGPFALVAQDGTRVTQDTLRGRFVLMTFGYTRCPDVCPTDLMAMTQALDRIGSAADAVTPVFVTVDPARDTPSVLAEYLGAFHPRFLGLSGTEEEVAAAARAYRVHRRKVLPAPGSADYYVDHGSLTYLLGRDGTLLTLFPTGTSADRMATVLATYLR